jgi:hypothetical protein
MQRVIELGGLGGIDDGTELGELPLDLGRHARRLRRRPGSKSDERQKCAKDVQTRRSPKHAVSPHWPYSRRHIAASMPQSSRAAEPATAGPAMLARRAALTYTRGLNPANSPARTLDGCLQGTLVSASRQQLASSLRPHVTTNMEENTSRRASRSTNQCSIRMGVPEERRRPTCARTPAGAWSRGAAFHPRHGSGARGRASIPGVAPVGITGTEVRISTEAVRAHRQSTSGTTGSATASPCRPATLDVERLPPPPSG